MTIYAKTARFDNPTPMSEDEMRKLAPSIFATTAHPDKSERFKPIATWEILQALAKEGFHPFGVQQVSSRRMGNTAFAKHLIRMRPVDPQLVYKVGDTVCEVILSNANDGTSKYELMAGMFRIRCMNSLVVQESELASVLIKHAGTKADIGLVIDGTYTVIEQAKAALNAPTNWSNILLATPEADFFAERSSKLLFPDPVAEELFGVAPPQPNEFDFRKLLNRNRVEDAGFDLWTTFNVVQENIMRGGLEYVHRNTEGVERNQSTRAVNGIDRRIELNKQLWKMAADTYLELA